MRSITSSLSDATDPANLVSNVQNGPSGPFSWNLGNNLTGVRSYDGLGRVVGGWVCNGSSQPYCSPCCQVYGFTNAWRGAQLTQSCDTALNQCFNYAYDEFNRLNSRTTTAGTVANYQYTYDRWGNRLTQTETSGSGGPQPNLSFNASNQITNAGYGYDAAGNMTNDGFHNYSYDAEGNISKVDNGTTAQYTYDGLNRRVQAFIYGSYPVEYVFNAADRRSSVWNGSNNTVYRGQYYWGAMPLGFYYNGQTYFQHQDWLGTERMRTSYNGGAAAAFTSLPFGDAQATTSGSNYDAYHFASLDTDPETGTDHAQFRQYNSTQGRWTSPDPYSGSYDFTNPQSFNRYAYVMNNPLSFTDSSGLDPCDSDEGGDCCDPLIYDCWGDSGPPDGGGGGGAPPAPKIVGFENLDPNRIMTESLGLPPGMLVPSGDVLLDALGLGSGTQCEFGACGSIIFNATQAEGQGGPDLNILIYQGDLWGIAKYFWSKNNKPAKNQKCLNKINSTPDGKFYNFFSPLSVIPGIGPDWQGSMAEDLGGSALKLGAYRFFNAASKSMVRTPFGSMSGLVAGSVETVAREALAPVAAAATVGQLTVHAGCAISAAF